MSYWQDDEQMQIDFFDNLNKTEVKRTRKVKGGIYRYPGTETYALYYNGALFYIEEHMPCLDIDVEHTSNLDEYELVEGYGLASVKVSKDKYEWQIRNSGIKHTKDYIIAKGTATKRFDEQITEYAKSF